MPKNPQPNAEERITALEAAMAHHQRDYEILNQVVLEQAKQLEQLGSRVTALRSQLDTLQSAIPDDRNPEDEKPPHY